MTIICPDPHITLPNDVLEMVAANSSQCGRLELEITKQDLFHFDEIAVGPFLLLRSLAILITDDYGQFPAINVISRSPNLRAFHFLDTIFGSPFNFEGLPPSLTSLQLANLQMAQVDEIARIFERFPRLLHFSSYCSYAQLQNLQPITAPPLRSLLLHRSPELLDVLTIPTLEHLEVVLWYNTPTHLLPFLTRSACQLTHLTFSVTANHILDEVFISCLAAVPTLPTLELIWVGRGPVLYHVLQRRDLVPDLRTLMITDITETAYPAFLTVLRARPALAHAELHVRPRHADKRARVELPRGEVRADFEALVQGGLSLRITTSNGAWPHPPWGDTYSDAVGNLDYDIFFSGRKTRPYFFSSF
ncbi:hypothetical protein B0H19DRAFT_155713 [Mycena capillaripes]|nr:hypothetical protein B0H19DRAFT_155713 [Mycena capillaripes]